MTGLRAGGQIEAKGGFKMKVKEIMTKEVTTISADMEVKEALDLLQRMCISGLPVVGVDGELVGMFTEKEVLGRILPSYINKVGSFIYDENPKSTKKKFAELNTMKVGSIMRKEMVTTREDITLCEATRVMLTQNARRLPVLDDSGRLVGIVSRGDIVKAFIQESATSG